MRERPSYLDPAKQCIPKLTDDENGSLLKFYGNRLLEARLPTTAIEIKNYKKLFKVGIIQAFTNKLDIIDQELETYFTDDFSKICLRGNGRRETLLSVGIGHDKNGAIDIRAQVRSKILDPIPSGDLGISFLGSVLEAIVVSNNYYSHNGNFS